MARFKNNVGGLADTDMDEPSDKKSSGKWIAGAIKHPGALHRELGVPAGKKIPAAKLAKAAHSNNPTLRRRVRFAKELKSFHH